MITGSVNPFHEAVIRLKVQGLAGQESEIEAVLDTGFTGFLTLPRTLIAALGLPWLTRGQVLLGNGQTEETDIYAATVIWDGQPVRVMVEAADTEPLVGMALMYGFDLSIRNVDGGPVTLQRIANP